MTDVRFTDLTLSEPLLAALDELGYETPTPVQASAIPMVATGLDLMVQSQTGTGKTAAFGIPLVEGLVPDKDIKALILCPTRELAKQVTEELNSLSKFKRIRSVPVYGGASLEKQVAEMRFAHIVVGTPGRVLDHLRRKTLKLDAVTSLVLDEADEMLSMGFAQELEQIMQFIPKERQTLLFSATIPEDIKRYARRYMNEPEFLSLIEENVASDDVEHVYYMVSGVGRCRDLCNIIGFEEPRSAIIFTNTRKDSEMVARALKKKGYDAEYLNGDLPQRERERVMQRSKNKELPFLVATDIAARGIDISDLSHVINFTLPESPEVYIHRTGRTGRAGAKGTAISLIGPREIGVYYYLKRIYNVALQERFVLSEAEILLRREEKETNELIESVLTSIDAPARKPQDLKRANRILERENAAEVVQVLLAHFEQRGKVSKAPPSVGGVLSDVPSPEHIAPGGRPQTLEGIANRVAIVRGEFRGQASKGESAPSKPDTKTTAAKSAANLPEDKKASSTAKPPKPASETSPEKTAKAPSARKARSGPKTKKHEETETTRKPTDKKSKTVETESGDKADAGTRQTARSKLRAAVKRVAAVKKSASQAPQPAKPPAQEEVAPPATTKTKRATSTEKAEPTVAPTAAKEPLDPADKEIDEDGRCRLFLNLGKKDRITSDGIRDSISELAGLLPEDIIDVELRHRHSFLIVDSEYVDDLVEAVNGESLGKRILRIEWAKAR